MIDNKKAMADLASSTADFSEKLSGFQQQDFNIHPADDKWSAAQVADHVMKMDGLLVKALQGPSTKADRDPKLVAERARAILADFERKLNSPETIKPGYEPRDVAETISRFIGRRKEISDLIPVTNLEELCLAFKHPALGEMTKYEWLYFVIYHTERHIGQLGRIADAISEK